MKERPILFSGPMVREILEGRKTQTRRVIRNVPYGDHFGKPLIDWPLSGIYEEVGKFWLETQTDVDDSSRTEIKCPYGQPGDRLWVRETWRQGESSFGKIPANCYYRADEYAQDGEGWRPSIFMPRWASRIALEITKVRVERVQDIQRTDAIAEGIDPWPEMKNDGDGQPVQTDSVKEFRRLWDSINAKRGFGWDKNPWVWVVEFKRV